MTDENKETVSTKTEQLLKRYWIGVWTVGVTFVITILISRWVPPDISSLFLVAIMISAWRGGLGVGIFATLLSVLIDVFIFLPPTASFSLDNDDFVQLIVDIVAAVVVGTLSASRSKAENERQRLLALERTARMEAEKANEVKDEFLAAVSHELRTPLTTIKTLTRLLIKKTSPEEKNHGYLLNIASECDRQIDLVHNLLDLSRIKAGGVDIEPEKINVAEILRLCEKIAAVEASERNHRLSAEAADDLFVCADGSALRRVICTVVENALKYTPDGGLIKLRAHHDERENTALIEISDNGRGISERDLPHIFESFYRGRNGKESSQEKNSGIGLGLYLARSLVEAMNGKITVESREGIGSRFMIYLPIWKSSAGENQPIVDTAAKLSREFQNL